MRTFHLAGRVCTVVLFVLTVVLSVSALDVPVVGGWNDKVKHLLAFLLLAFGLAAFWGVPALRVLCWLAVFGVAVELLQWFLPWRQAGGYDVVADLLGIAAGVWLARVR